MNATFKFYAVGQGTFYGGSIRNEKRDFVVVYDCGSISRKAHLNKSIDEFRCMYDHIDLLIVSHFHKDHVNGIKTLIEGKRVERVVLPYVPLFHRLALVAADDDPDDDYIRLLTDPTEFFLGEESQFDVGRVYIVDQGLDSFDLVNPPVDGPSSGSALNENDSERSFSLDGFKQYEEVQKRELEEDESLIRTGVSFLKPYSRFTLGVEIWEFIFYHRKTRNETDVELFRDALISFRESEGIATWRELFSDEKRRIQIQSIYDNNLGFGNLNHSSLCLYHGSLGSTESFWTFRTKPASMRRNTMFRVRYRESDLFRHEGLGTLLTGDQYLKSDTDFTSFIDFFRNRLGRVTVFQVPHHGSAANWKPLPNALNEEHHLERCYVINHGYGRAKHPNHQVFENLSTFAPGSVFLNNEHVELVCEWHFM